LDRIAKYADNLGPYQAQGLSVGIEVPATGGTEKHAFMIMLKILG